MNLQELIELVQTENPDMAKQLVDMAIQLMETENPEMAERLKAQAKSGKFDGELTKINVDVSYRLEKFEGEYVPGAMPFEVLEGAG